ncbi:hypothetical protein RhiirA1_398323 [Rhizophagus irregularis]|uniref:Transposase domain-containing protein n=1 Tax=Rhizophagus irregularis TaxID=588596 RepID=A0A2N0RE24_9GLOM|nr:hypothetical protein RhiirA1_398323 [Rhizophagus irregularis]
MYRLPYFDPVQFLIVDPMHCLFLGIAKWIVTRLWIEERRLTSENLTTMQERANRMKLLSDIGRIPSKIMMGEGFSGFTADQWKNFILIYATSITWDLLKNDDRKILSYFVRACNILTCRIISKSGLEEAHKCLLSMVKLVENSYGPGKITPNMHLCLHICECALDYGPLYAFWCYSFERMNGLLGSLQSSNQHIEPANENQHLSECLPYITHKEKVGSLAHDDFDLLEYFEFLSMSKNVKEKAGIGSEPFPGALLKPKKEANLPQDILKLLIEYYNSAYDNYFFISLSDIHNALPEAIGVLPKVTKFGRLRIGVEVIGSTFSARHIRSVNVLSQFILDDNHTTDIYPGQVQFFFEHTIHLPEGSKTHCLAFVRWYKKTENRKYRFHCQIDNDDLNICNIELWENEFYELSQDCIIPIHNILKRFVAGKMTIGKKNPKSYLSVIPINRKIHI